MARGPLLGTWKSARKKGWVGLGWGWLCRGMWPPAGLPRGGGASPPQQAAQPQRQPLSTPASPGPKRLPPARACVCVGGEGGGAGRWWVGGSSRTVCTGGIGRAGTHPRAPTQGRNAAQQANSRPTPLPKHMHGHATSPQPLAHLDGNVGAGPDGNAHIGLREGRRVIDAVAALQEWQRRPPAAAQGTAAGRRARWGGGGVEVGICRLAVDEGARVVGGFAWQSTRRARQRLALPACTPALQLTWCQLPLPRGRQPARARMAGRSRLASAALTARPQSPPPWTNVRA